ncbi:hypothetical protein EDB81DRAFT_804604 [Dactylonectria macrodidyma]|uniref:Uncharacterized protein n=1 Tax=Dactylonectria macrodidyma TaxID=307937 RepID=A0A9P9EAJ1_9HYPO|nr:hypothetical protein EDB81DRAFT_804604 [Dactylonectria macrodidyma]
MAASFISHIPKQSVIVSVLACLAVSLLSAVQSRWSCLGPVRWVGPIRLRLGPGIPTLGLCLTWAPTPLRVLSTSPKKPSAGSVQRQLEPMPLPDEREGE